MYCIQNPVYDHKFRQIQPSNVIFSHIVVYLERSVTLAYSQHIAYLETEIHSELNQDILA